MIDELKRIGVDPGAFNIFADKARHLVLKFDELSCAQANVLKQTALLCGADAAIPRSTYFGGRRKKVSVLLLANARELQKIKKRLTEQKWLVPIVKDIDRYMHMQESPSARIRGKTINFTRTFVMGIMNITPDSFYKGSRFFDTGSIRDAVHTMVSAGVDIIDVGAESSRPGSRPVSARTEISRLKKVLPAIAKSTSKIIAIDTYKAAVAAFAIDNGASIVNDISALRLDKQMAALVARTNVGLLLMHMKGTPRTMQRNPRYRDLMGELYNFFTERIAYAAQQGIDAAQILIDPGLGFGKRLHDNYEIITRLPELTIFNRPICVGHSRKSFIGKPDALPPEERLEGTLGISSILINNGAHILRVHDVRSVKRVVVLTDRILS
jgi:dihydropteroate synthase